MSTLEALREAIRAPANYTSKPKDPKRFTQSRARQLRLLLWPNLYRKQRRKLQKHQQKKALRRQRFKRWQEAYLLLGELLHEGHTYRDISIAFDWPDGRRRSAKTIRNLTCRWHVPGRQGKGRRAKSRLPTIPQAIVDEILLALAKDTPVKAIRKRFHVNDLTIYRLRWKHFGKKIRIENGHWVRDDAYKAKVDAFLNEKNEKNNDTISAATVSSP